MNTIQLRFLYFLVGCIPSRLLLVWVGKHHSNTDTERTLLAVLTFSIGLSFLFLFLSGYRSTGPEVFGADIWWKSLRIVHAMMYLAYAFMIYYDTSILWSEGDRTNAWKLLLCDALFGLASFLVYHYRESNFILLP